MRQALIVFSLQACAPASYYNPSEIKIAIQKASAYGLVKINVGKITGNIAKQILIDLDRTLSGDYKATMTEFENAAVRCKYTVDYGIDLFNMMNLLV